LSRAERVLVVRLDQIGDMVLTTPFLRELRRNLPQASITLVVRPATHNLVELCPYADRVLAYAPPGWARRPSLLAIAHAERFARRHLRPARFDLAIAPRWDTDADYAVVMALLSGARWRAGYSERVTEDKHVLNRGLDRLLTHVCEGGADRHEATKNLDLVRFLGGSTDDDRLELWLGEADERFAEAFLARHGVRAGDPLLALAPGAGNPRRRWPAAGFGELAAWSRGHLGGFVLVVGGEEDEALGEEVRRRAGAHVINAAGRASLRETAALLKRCRLFVGNDAGPMHLAAASGLPVVAIFCHPRDGDPHHENSPLRFGPWGTGHVVVRPAGALAPCVGACSSTRAHCIGSVPAADVIAAVARLLAHPPSTPS
jgi:ADP-heptose:LPS heptosyltransferase